MSTVISRAVKWVVVAIVQWLSEAPATCDTVDHAAVMQSLLSDPVERVQQGIEYRSELASWQFREGSQAHSYGKRPCLSGRTKVLKRFRHHNKSGNMNTLRKLGSYFASTGCQD